MVMTMNNYFNVGNRVHDLRTERGLSQEQLALMSDITPSYLGQIERNIKNPTIHIIEKLCFSMDVSLADFFRSCPAVPETDILSLQIISQLKNRTADEKKYLLDI